MFRFKFRFFCWLLFLLFLALWGWNKRKYVAPYVSGNKPSAVSSVISVFSISIGSAWLLIAIRYSGLLLEGCFGSRSGNIATGCGETSAIQIGWGRSYRGTRVTQLAETSVFS